MPGYENIPGIEIEDGEFIKTPKKEHQKIFIRLNSVLVFFKIQFTNYTILGSSNT